MKAAWHPDDGGWQRYERGSWRRVPFLLVSRLTWFGEHRCWYLFDEGQALFLPVANQDVLTTTNVANQTYTSDATWNNKNNRINVISGGGGGGNATITTGGSGGGGGQLSGGINFTFATPGTTTATYRLDVGGAASSGTAPDAWFNGTAVGTATFGSKGGTGGASNGGAAGVGNTAGGNAVLFNGGDGAVGTTAGGGGGGAAGFNGAGSNGTVSAGGDADNHFTVGPAASANGNDGTEYDATHGSGTGAAGRASGNASGFTGALYGGAGSGARFTTGGTKTGGAGAQALIVLTWTILQPVGPMGDTRNFQPMVAQ